MTSRYKKLTVAFTLVFAAAIGVALALPSIIHEWYGEDEAEAEFPTALGRHIEKLKEAAPGNQGIAEEGPSSAAESAFLKRAFPADTISVAQASAARNAFAASMGRPFPRGKGRKGTWVTVGPSNALYPFTDLRNSFNYVPNAYVAGGRTTSIALAAACKPGDCRAYVTPAGGGVWRTKNALTGEPHWVYLGGPLGINAAGSVYLDPNDPSGNTVYVGTGEANICGSGCVAGTGLYKSTDGGDTWSGPLGGRHVQRTWHRHDRRQARLARHDLRGCDDRAARHVVGVLQRRHPAGAGRGAVGPVQVDRRRRDLVVHPRWLGQRWPTAPAT